MQRNYIHYIYILILTILAACSDSAAIIEEKPEQEHDGIELTGIKAVVAGSSTSTTRSSADEYNTDYVGRSTFINDDEMIITKFERTQAALSHYSYKNIFYKSNSDLAWARTKGDGVNGYEAADRIYWSDNASYHTFIGYSLPQDWKNEARTDRANKWTKTSLTDVFHGQFSKSSDNYVDFTVNGTFTSANNFTGDFEKEAKTNLIVDKKGTRLKNEDLLLFYNTEQLADIGGMTTTLHYHHALASLRVIIDIREFAVSSTTQDAKTTIKNLLVLKQPWKYKWTQSGSNTSENDTDQPGWGVVNDMQPGDLPVTIKAWQPRPQGEGTGSDKTFTFYSLIVPGAQTKEINGHGFDMQYTVTYPKALKPNEMEDHTYGVHMNEITFKAGYCTTVRVSLNHQGEPINIGAMYYNWDDVSTPDKSNLQKVSTFLDTSVRDSVTIAGDQKATIEDATWLYINGDNNLVDIYGNDGSQSNPFTIKTARQFLSFAYEVNSGNNGVGRTFNDQYVKLEADLFLQPENTESKWTINWPGIGVDGKSFDGYFDGGNRIIKLLKGSPLFVNIGANAHIETLDLEDVIGDITGGGCLANVNKGILCGCQVLAKNNRTITLSTTSNSYAGFICGENQGTIIACDAQGDFKSTAHFNGGITGNNDGSIVASIAIGNISSTITSPTFGGITARNSSTDIHYCCFDKNNNNVSNLGDKDITQIIGLSTTEMQKENIVKRYNESQNKYEEKKPSEYLTEIIGSSTIPESLTDEQKTNIAALPDNLNTAILKWSSKKDWANSKHFVESRYYTHHVGQYPRVH